MFGRHRARELPERTNPPRELAPRLQHSPAPRRAPVGGGQPGHERLGAHLLSGPPGARPKPRLRAALPGPALAENIVEDVANPHALRRPVTHTQPTETRLVGEPNPPA